MQKKPEIATTPSVMSALLNPRSKFERYHALRVVEEMAKHAPGSPEVVELYDVITQLVQGRSLDEGSDSRGLADRILSKGLDKPLPDH